MTKKSTILLITLVFLPLFLSGQSFIWHADSLVFHGNPGDNFDIHANVENISGQDLSILIIRTQNILPNQDWFSSMCNAVVCFPPEVDTIFIPDPLLGVPPLAPGEIAEFHIQVGTSLTLPGTALVTVKVENINNLNENEVNTFTFSTEATGLVDSDNPTSGTFHLLANYPNPFNPSTKIPFEVGGGKALQVKINVYNVLGQKVINLVNKKFLPGAYKATWNAVDQSGKNVTSGVYFYDLQAGAFRETRKMLLLK